MMGRSRDQASDVIDRPHLPQASGYCVIRKEAIFDAGCAETLIENDGCIMEAGKPYGVGIQNPDYVVCHICETWRRCL